MTVSSYLWCRYERARACHRPKRMDIGIHPTSKVQDQIRLVLDWRSVKAGA